ncbi:protease SohB [Aliamphritea spongicola]|nr:protease SohB [Aliamphritea spongicola]
MIDFDGDIKASELEPMREEITAILTMATEKDEVVVRLESPGGMVHTYGLAASQLERIKRQGVPLTVCVDKVAASGGYMMACLADKIIAAPFAILGSIGVVAQLPNFHRLLKKYDVDYEVLTAGEYKRTMTVLGENTEKGREKFIEDLEDTHLLFKEFVGEFRPQVDLEKVATGEVWFGRRSLDVNLIDELQTSDEYLIAACQDADVFTVRYEYKKNLQERLSDMSIKTADSLLVRWLGRLTNVRLLAK